MLVLSRTEGTDPFGNICKRNSCPLQLCFDTVIATRSPFCCGDAPRSRGVAGAGSPAHVGKTEALRTNRTFRRSHTCGN